MADNFSIIFILLFVFSGQHFVGGAVTHGRREKDTSSISNWKDKLSQVLDTESEELQILHNLIERGESGNGDIGEIDTPMNSKTKAGSNTPTPTGDNKSSIVSTDSIAYLREEGIISKLEENSKRMDSMVGFLNDLKNVLGEAITAQDKQMRFETEVVDLREEIEFLRKEVQHLKHEQTLLTMNKDQHSLEHKIHNEETTIQWLKDSSKELQTQLKEISRSCNSSTLLHLQQTLDQQRKTQQTELLVVQRQIQGLQLQQLKQEELITEANGEIGDVRSWQTKMGQKMVDGQLQLHSMGDDKMATNIVDVEEHFLTEALKEASKFSPKQGRHSKKLKAQLRDIHKTTRVLAKDHYHMNKRLENLEESQKITKEMVSNLKISARDTEKSPTEMENRLIGLEGTMAQYTLSLQTVGDKVNVVNELQESTTQIFSALEDLESRYDEKFTEMQTNLVKMEASVSGITNSNENLKEQQIYQVGIIQNVKKDLLKTKDHLQKNHFRLAFLQTHLLKWSSQKCSVEDSESIQNIRISSLESLLHSGRRV